MSRLLPAVVAHVSAAALSVYERLCAPNTEGDPVAVSGPDSPDNPLNRVPEQTALLVLSVREQLELEGGGSAVRDELAELLRAHNESADGTLAYPGEYLVRVPFGGEVLQGVITGGSAHVVVC
jgi:hypothetical protein